MAPDRGFVTIATGGMRYFELARNLLRSYRHCTAKYYPFAIITDRENEITAEFDRVILIDDPDNSYMDKLKLYRELPFDETIFIDADSLAFGDLNAWWDLFAECGDFCAFGYTRRGPDSGQGWFEPSGMQEYTDRISFVPDFNGGVYYMRRGDTCKEVFDVACHAAREYHRFQFYRFAEPADEPVLSLGMAVCGCETLHRKEMCFAPNPGDVTLDISVPSAVMKTPGGPVPVRLIHWGNYRTKKSLYRFEVCRLEALRKDPGCVDTLSYRLLYRRRLLYRLLHIYDLTALFSRVRGRLKRALANRSKKQ